MIAINDFASEAARWHAVTDRDSAASKAFVYGVLTTGIYCRPGCASRLPKRENVRFFDNWRAAEVAGLRPCKRCTPNMPQGHDPGAQAAVQACRIIEWAENPPTLNDLAEAVGLSPFHFHRLFKKVIGITPKEYAAQVRLERVKDNIQPDVTITEALYSAGFESSSRFYDSAVAALGMKPADFQRGGSGVKIRYAIVTSYLGWVLVAATTQGICQIEFAEEPGLLRLRLQERFPQAELLANDPDFNLVIRWVLSFLERPGRGLGLPLDIQGTAFQRQVWNALQKLTPGSTASYGEIAAQVGRPTAARAVAQACAANRIAVAIPCHRVLRGDGELGGYRWGVDRKRTILEREASAQS